MEDNEAKMFAALGNSSDSRSINGRYAAFQNKRIKLEQREEALRAEQKAVEEEETRIQAKKHTLELRRNQIENEKAVEEIRMYEDVFDKTMSVMIRIAGVQNDNTGIEERLQYMEGRIRQERAHFEASLLPKSSEPRLPPFRPNPLIQGRQFRKPEASIPQKRKLYRPSVQPYVESDSDSAGTPYIDSGTG